MSGAATRAAQRSETGHGLAQLEFKLSYFESSIYTTPQKLTLVVLFVRFSPQSNRFRGLIAQLVQHAFEDSESEITSGFRKEAA